MTDQEELQLLYLNRPVTRPSARTWAKHLALLGLTFCTATLAGTIFPFGHYNWLDKFDPQTLSDVLQLPLVYPALIASAVRDAFATPAELAYGLKFAVSLLFI